jgi:hypothetical protein
MKTRDYPITADERRWVAMWKDFTGTQHGPLVEYVSMPYEKLFDFCRCIETTEVERCAKIAEEGSFPFDIQVWLESTKKEMTSLVAKAIAAEIRKPQT